MLTTAVSPANTQLLAAVDTIARQDLQPLAHRIDRGHYPLEIMAKLGQAAFIWTPATIRRCAAKC